MAIDGEVTDADEVRAAPKAVVVKRAPVVKKQSTVPAGVVTIAATGDIVMGSTPNLPPDGGRSFFDGVQTDLAGDVVLAGSFTRPTTAVAGDNLHADYGPLGTVSFRFV